MREILLSSAASLAFATLVLIIWHFRCRRRRWVKKKADYVWAFIDGGITYVMAALLIEHNLNGSSYSQILAHGFGEPQVNVAFIGALFEATWALWDMWNGNGLQPGPEA